MASATENGINISDSHDDLEDVDPELFEILQKEKQRQLKGLELIASTNYAEKHILQALGSCVTNVISEGVVGQRISGGNEFVDEMELLCQKRALDAFNLDPSKWGVNVQVLSGAPANLVAFTALAGPHGRIMGLDQSDGGHFSHGYRIESKKISTTSIFFETVPYKVDPLTGLIDYEQLQQTARLFSPNIIIAGISCYPRRLDYRRFRDIADENGSFLLGDMAHTCGLVATGLDNNPFDYCDVVTSSTYKTLRGPRGGMIFYRKGTRKVKGKEEEYDIEDKINTAVFPGIQSATHNSQIAALAVALKQAMTPEFKEYQRQVIKNAQTVCKSLQDKGYTIATGGTDNHMVLVDLRSSGIDAIKAEHILEEVGITITKYKGPGGKSLTSAGIRIGTPALTSRGFIEKDMLRVCDFVHRALMITKEAMVDCGPSINDFKHIIHSDEGLKEQITTLRQNIENFAISFPMPGLDNY